MRRYLLDTGIAGMYISRRGNIRERIAEETAKGNRIGISLMNLAELYYGVENSQTREANLKRLVANLGHFTIWPFTQAAAKEYGRIATQLKRAGRSIQQIDMLIAAVAMTIPNCTVVTLDTDLSAVNGLAVENWTTT